LALQLLVDEDTQSRRLVQLLVDAGHDVVSVSDEELEGVSDEVVLDRARTLGRALLTQNVRDFRELHEENPEHPGILCVFHERDRSKDLSYVDIVRAIANLEAAELDIAGEYVVLNAWR